MSRRIRGSSAEKGSSMRSISCSVASARARPTLCFMPPESSAMSFLPCPSRPTAGRVSSAFFLRSCAGTPWISRPKAMLSKTVRFGNSPKCWKTIPIFLRRTCLSCLDGISEIKSPSR